jgi:putative selenium metabolism protein SsnA
MFCRRDLHTEAHGAGVGRAPRILNPLIMPSPLLIENGTVLSTGGRPSVRHNCSVLIENGLITRVAPKDRFGRFAGRRLNAAGRMVMPGLINAHTHFYSTFARGLTTAKPAQDFNGVLRNLWWRLDSALTTEDCYYSALIALLDAIRHGTTTILDHHASPRAIAGSLGAIERAVKETGLRACLCYEVSDRDGARIAKEGLAENVLFIRRCQQRQDAHLKALFGLHASFTLSDASLEKAASLGHELRTGFHIHVAEAESDQAAARRASGMRVVERLKQFDILGRRSVAAHCVHVNRKEMDLLAETQTAVVHNPQSNMNNAVGVADVIGMSRRNILLGLGTDAMTANMLEELRAALWGQHLSTGNPSAGFSEVVAALFVNNPKIAGRIFGLRFGEIREGCAGDAVIFDYTPPTPLEGANLFGHLVFGLSQSAVDSTIVGGRVLMENKRLELNLDEERVTARARELAGDLWKRL